MRSRLALLLVPLLTLAAPLACRVDEQAPEAKPAAETYRPLAPAPGRFVSADGRISVPVPAGEGWECLEEQHGEGSAAAVAVRCRRQDPRELLFFSAKTHRQPAEQRADAETVLMTLYRTDNESFFDTLEYVQNGPASLAGAPGWEAELRASHARIGEVRKRERLSVVGDRIYSIAAEGQPGLWQQHQAAVEAWFADVQFAR